MQKGVAKAGGGPEQSIPYITLHGFSQEALRPPHPWPYARFRAATFRF